MATLISEEAKERLYEAYRDVRSDSSETKWCIASYPDNGKQIELTGSGTDYSEFLNAAQDDQRMYAYVRYQTGDEMSKRSKFAFITWIGPEVSALKTAKVSTDKAFVQQIFKNFGVEVFADEHAELSEDNVKSLLEKAGGQTTELAGRGRCRGWAVFKFLDQNSKTTQPEIMFDQFCNNFTQTLYCRLIRL